jgi:hypothetical protein
MVIGKPILSTFVERREPHRGSLRDDENDFFPKDADAKCISIRAFFVLSPPFLDIFGCICGRPSEILSDEWSCVDS